MVLSFENHLIDPIFFSSDPRLSKKAEESLLVDNQALQFAQVKTDTDNGKRRQEREATLIGNQALPVKKMRLWYGCDVSTAI